MTRDPACVERWPGYMSFEYDPRCCRFPKSCSAGVDEWPWPTFESRLVDEPLTWEGMD